jgi:hypothetical protein
MIPQSLFGVEKFYCNQLTYWCNVMAYIMQW